jgi:hypothetical protein
MTSIDAASNICQALPRGDLFVHWEAGAAVFDRDLVDADWAVNNGNWMWLSCSCFFYQYFRVYGRARVVQLDSITTHVECAYGFSACNRIS